MVRYGKKRICLGVCIWLTRRMVFSMKIFIHILSDSSVVFRSESFQLFIHFTIAHIAKNCDCGLFIKCKAFSAYDFMSLGSHTDHPVPPERNAGIVIHPELAQRTFSCDQDGCTKVFQRHSFLEKHRLYEQWTRRGWRSDFKRKGWRSGWFDPKPGLGLNIWVTFFPTG